MSVSTKSGTNTFHGTVFEFFDWRLMPELAKRQVLKDINGPIDDTVPAVRPITLRDLLTFRMGFGMVFGPPDTPIQKASQEARIAGLKPFPPAPHRTALPDKAHPIPPSAERARLPLPARAMLLLPPQRRRPRRQDPPFPQRPSRPCQKNRQARARQRLQGETGQLQLLRRGALGEEHDLEKWRVAEAPLRHQLAHQALEGEVLVGVVGEGRPPHAVEKL